MSAGQLVSELYEFEKGDLVQDTITEFKGVIFGRHDWYNGCVRYSLIAPELNSGKPVEGTFDSQQLVLVAANHRPPPIKETRRPTGGPYPDTASSRDAN